MISDREKDRKEFLSRWIPFGMTLKAKADGFGVEWRDKDLEVWMNEITFAEEFAKPPTFKSIP